jgi:hypothetical protein
MNDQTASTARRLAEAGAYSVIAGKYPKRHHCQGLERLRLFGEVLQGLAAKQGWNLRAGTKVAFA